MNEKSFTKEYRKSVDSLILPPDFKSRIISNLNDISKETAKKQKLNPPGIVASAVAAGLVVLIGTSAILSSARNDEIKLKICSAVDARELQGATVTLLDENGNALCDSKGDPLVVTSDDKGMIRAQIPKGMSAKVRVEKDGYIEVVSPIENENVYISPVLGDNTYRAVLTWDGDYDLDAHLSMEKGERYEKLFYFKSDILDEQGVTLAALDLDSTDSSKPETITFNTCDDATFRFTVGSYSSLKNSESIDLSEAKPTVTLYKGESVIGVYSQNETDTGNAWQVFEIKDGVFTLSDYTYTVSSFWELR
ncbi:MAG: hypothetical protein PUA85_03435 [Oscillospiraceae bacterium]|nr:hypothetical protein [Oscillospiraceae bacterium]